MADVSNAKIYYFNTVTNALEPVNAVFDLTAKTVSFYTDHLSTYLIKAGVTPTADNPDTGDVSAAPLDILLVLAAAFAIPSVYLIARKRNKAVK